MTKRVVAMAMVIGLGLLAGCGQDVDPGDLTDVKEIDQVLDADSTCITGYCTVDVSVERQITAPELEVVLGGLHDLDASEISVHVGREDLGPDATSMLTVAIGDTSDPDLDGARARAAIALRSTPSFHVIRVSAAPKRSVVSVVIRDSTSIDTWQVVREVHRQVADLPNVELQLGIGDPTRIEVEARADLPDLSAAEGLDADPDVTSLVVDREGVLAGVVDEAARSRLAVGGVDLRISDDVTGELR